MAMNPSIRHQNRTVRVAQQPIIENALAETYLTATIAAASGTLTVKDIAKFAVGKYVWIDPFGPNSEIIAVHASTAPSGSTITLAANTAFAHAAGQKVYYIEFNQVEISHASTLTGAKSVLSTEALTARERDLAYLDTTQTSGYYFARFKDSVAGTFGSYSDGVIYGGWADNAVGHMIDRALSELSITFSNKVTIRDCLSWLTEGMRTIQGKQRRWLEHFSYNTIIGQAQRGTNIVTMPSDAYDTETRRSVLAVRIGDNRQLRMLDPDAFDAQMEGVKVTQVRTAASAADTTLELDNSYDFDDSGTVVVYVSGTKYSITYTGVTRDDVDGATAVLTGVPASGDGSITVTIPVDTYVWQDESEGLPVYGTVRNGNLEFWPLVDAEEDNANIYMDYAKVATTVNSEIDTIDFHRYDMLFYYLTWRIEAKERNNGKLDFNSGWYALHKEALNDAIRTMPTIQSKTTPGINRMSRRGGNGKPDVQQLSVDNQ